MTCSQCHREMDPENLLTFVGKTFCKDCLNEIAEALAGCPCCGAEISGNDDGVELLLTRPDASAEERGNARKILVNVCPRCRILFVDKQRYQQLQPLLG